jgi:hypothetical protein
MRRLIWGFTLLVGAGPAVAALDDKAAPADQVKSLIADYQTGQQEYYEAIGKAKSADEQIKAQEKRPKPQALAIRLLELVEQNPTDPGVTPVALVHVVTLPLNGAEGTKLQRQALEQLTRDHAASDQLGPIVLRLTYQPSPAVEAFLRAVVDKNPKDELKGKATYGLGGMLQQAAGYARLMRKQPDLEQRIEAAFGKETAEWLRDVDADRLEKEAEELFETAADKFADVPMFGEESLGDAAKGQLFEIRNLAIGKTAPEIEGEDLDGTPFKLSDYRGKVVVIDFWGNW